MCAAIRWERPPAAVSGDGSHATVLRRTACEALLNTSPETIVAMTLTLPIEGRPMSGQLMDLALDMAAANSLITEVAGRASHVDVRLTRQYRGMEGENP